jgi:hypothetical protein
VSERIRSKLMKRVRRRMMGGRVDIRIYANGTCRFRVDHPSNDPEIEFAMAGRLYRLAREAFAQVGLDEAVLRPITWRDDP